jgi:Polyketide cyclase / dehydrase and lipid transport
MRAELEWNPAAESVEKLTDGAPCTGTRFRAKWKGGPPVEVTIVRYDRPNTWEMHNGGPLEVLFKARLEPVAEGTRLSVDFDARPHGWFRVIFPLVILKLRRDEKANMTYIRETLEG